MAPFSTEYSMFGGLCPENLGCGCLETMEKGQNKERELFESNYSWEAEKQHIITMLMCVLNGWF